MIAEPGQAPERIDCYRPEPFHPAEWLRHPHMQTIYGEVMPRPFNRPDHAAWEAACKREELALPDGDRVVVWTHFHPDDTGRRKPVVVHFHGLEGSADASYQRGLSSKAFAAGFDSVRVNFRNCGDTEHLARRFYFGAHTEEVVAALETVHRDFGFERVYGTGVSLGANMLLHALCDWGAQPPAWLKGVVAVSAPVQMAMAGEALKSGFNRIYDIFFLRALGAKLRKKMQVSPGGADLLPYLERMRTVRTLAEFDEFITAPLGGYENAAHYYRAGSSGPRLGDIRVPALLIHAEDDPFVPFAGLQMHAEAIAANPWLATAFTRAGGHVGFVADRRAPVSELWMDDRWSENEAIRFLRHADIH
ncbi:MAG: alpha/beta fold hydrolase [Candidatus Sericytochromatia bacterium]|uniref:Alpha/beta fold hydrolase n=1 Tax=Candidatus Tanganyikabacteria bacterium TaxID=2961651 RepID=A0A937X4P9_9BACT|nr:alpha/beta fold hydrolase [Candidatus Tanganyikabacteria bacterium]